MCSLLFSFPQDIFYLFANYLLVDDDQNKKIFHFSYDWRNFMNTSKVYFAEWKRESQIITLNWKFAERFQKSSYFRSRILQTIQNPLLQLDLFFVVPDDDDRRPVVDLSKVNGVRKLHIEECKLRKIELLDVEELVLDACKVSDLSFCANVKKLTFGNCERLTLDVSCLRSLEEFDLQHEDAILVNLESLVNLKKFHILPNNYISVNFLRNVPDLSFASCHGITDVGCLANVPDLTFYRCRGIRDVSSLGNVHKLDLSYCENIRDVSALGNVHTLDLSSCPKVTDISTLVNVHSLAIQSFQGTDLSGLSNVVILDISNSPKVRDISCLMNVQRLNISKCPKIHDFTGLHRLKELIAYHPLVVKRGMETIQRLHTLRIGKGSFPNSATTDVNPQGTTQGSNIYISQLTNLISLQFQDCTTLSAFPSSALTNLRSLIIEGCEDLVSIPTLSPSLGHLRIIECPSIKTLVLSGSSSYSAYPIYRVEIKQCSGLKNVEIHRNVFFMNVEDCDSLKRMEITTQVDRVRVYQCCDLRSIIGLKRIVSLLDEETAAIYEEDPGEEYGEDESDSDQGEDDNDDDDEEGDDEDNEDVDA
jgi:hypothetical protein